MELGNDFFLFKCLAEDTIIGILTKGPWVVARNFVAIQKWKPDFYASK